MENNEKGLGSTQKELLIFARKHPNTWLSYNQDSVTKRVILSLVKRELIDISEKFGMFRYTLPQQMQLVLPLIVDYDLGEDSEGIEFAYIWSKKGEGYGRIAYVYGECGVDAKDLAAFIVKACNEYIRSNK